MWKALAIVLFFVVFSRHFESLQITQPLAKGTTVVVAYEKLNFLLTVTCLVTPCLSFSVTQHNFQKSCISMTSCLFDLSNDDVVFDPSLASFPQCPSFVLTFKCCVFLSTSLWFKEYCATVFVLAMLVCRSTTFFARALHVVRA